MIPNNGPLETFTMPKEWVYRGEGNCNVVISLPKSRKILRIRKTQKPTSLLGWILVIISDFLYWCYGKGIQEELRDLNFYLKIMRPLLGYKYTSDAEQVFLTRKQMHIFKHELSKIRPEFRQHKTLQYGRAALFDDFAFLPIEFNNVDCAPDTFSIEIKPKQGWRPLKEQIYPQCFFCMNQFLKIEKKQIKTRTKYCPEDLFFGDKEKMKTALKNLIEIPQNNFKIFKNGVVCYDEKHKNMNVLKDIFQSEDSNEILNEALCDFLQRCLVTGLTRTDTEFTNCNCTNSLKNIKYSDSHTQTELSKGSVLEKILSVQMMDQEGSHSTYKKLSKNDSWDDWSFVERLLEVVDSNKEKDRKINLEVVDNNKEKDRKISLEEVDSDKERDSQKDVCVRCNILEASKKSENELHFVPYLISAIAKDCSLMITFRKVNEEPGDQSMQKNIFHTKYGNYLVNIGVFDLYPKPLSTIYKHYKRNKDIFKALKTRESGT